MRADSALVSAKKDETRESHSSPRGESSVIAYRTRIAYFDVMSRQISLKVSHFSLASCSIVRISLKETISVGATPQSQRT